MFLFHIFIHLFVIDRQGEVHEKRLLLRYREMRIVIVPPLVNLYSRDRCLHAVQHNRDDMVLARFPATAGEIGLLGEESLFLPARKRSQLEREVFHSRRRGDEAERGGGYRSPGRFVLLFEDCRPLCFRSGQRKGGDPVQALKSSVFQQHAFIRS
ncbi:MULTISPECIES: hypothetical protein [Bacteroides]|uniref:hypothetical protein n=1 Tax=Bacteroides TaxID=816 RepID=UPI0010F81DFE|nr:hypothetical protein [Bacteroides fragilis]MCM0364989.1 hypothetical protein [Bacteroides fragilis]MDA1490569.1 hypothetical protein [Bacteroides fragilis]QCQ56362.1 hypothetical protein EC81_022710 [Bacteroides fragilis]